MKLLGRTQPLSRYPILECLAVIARLGFDGVEICLENPDLAPGGLTPALAAAVRERVQALGLRPHSVSYHKDYVRDDREFDLTLRAIELTPDFGARVFVFSGPFRQTGDAAEWERMVERTRQLARLAESRGVTLAEEFEPGFVVGSTADLLRLFDAVDSDSLAANLDLGHAFLCDPDPLDSIRQLGPRIAHCHIENMRAGAHEHLLPHEGDMNLADYLRALAGTGFQGGLALDLYKHDYEAVAPGAIAYLRRLIAGVTGG
jgi:sugar phosphate isomerase/epimerase